MCVCVYVYPHATCDNDESIHDTCCFTVLLTIAINSCLLFADRHVCMNVQMQGTKRTLLPHAVPTLQCMPFHKDGI